MYGVVPGGTIRAASDLDRSPKQQPHQAKVAWTIQVEEHTEVANLGEAGVHKGAKDKALMWKGIKHCCSRSTKQAVHPSDALGEHVAVHKDGSCLCDVCVPPRPAFDPHAHRRWDLCAEALRERKHPFQNVGEKLGSDLGVDSADANLASEGSSNMFMSPISTDSTRASDNEGHGRSCLCDVCVPPRGAYNFSVRHRGEAVDEEDLRFDSEESSKSKPSEPGKHKTAWSRGGRLLGMFSSQRSANRIGRFSDHDDDDGRLGPSCRTTSSTRTSARVVASASSGNAEASVSNAS
eukprot:CAMPEP_0177512486 /NCGR_PEP_ID=MMETSP0369-20130122/43246_1 /TAXON_ID=447022 ORGANISM="Scrippsiella hangoei-like, Strain SHHI-4" /NCGR_SAMPLE_ID=MMETSP0369 /ASSEMBLY_ACC=CAM_ASM_000364 /LENGTH=292 /DNA_ID=CAMNT_0018990987 /DNA_START=58 /DNA_END=936 /DNA_ORIENTATION=-